MADIKIHNPILANNSVFKNLHLERLASDPTPLTAGRVWFNTTDKAFKHTTLDAGGAVVVNSFATAEALTAALTAYVKHDGSVAFTGDINAGSHKVINVAAPTADTDAANKAYVDGKVSALGNAFNYVGTVEGGATSGAAFDLSTLTQKDAGDYYKVTTAGYFKVGAAGTTFFANVNDGVVFNTAAGVDLIDNTQGSVSGTANEIAVTGSVDTGFTVAIDSAFKTRVSDLETLTADHETRLDTAEAKIGATPLTTTAQTLTGAIEEVKALAGDGTGALKTAINAQKYAFTSSTPATTFTVTHNMGADVMFQVLVKNGDGKYQNDIPYVVATDNNTLTVELSESSDIKVFVWSMAALV